MSDYGVVSKITASTLSIVRQDSLIKFDNEYTWYSDKIKQVNLGRASSSRITPSSIRQCIDATLQTTLCIIGKKDNASTMEEANDGTVQKWVEEQLSLAPEDLTERVRSAIDSVCCQVNKQGPSGSALYFVVNIVSALDRNNASEIIKDKEACKGLIVRMINKLKPPELRERMKKAREYWKSDNKADISYFEQTLSSNAVQVNKGEMIRARISKRGQKRSLGSSTADVSPVNKKKKGNDFKEKKSGNGKRTNKDTWKLGCLNKEHCQGIHRIMDCPITTEDRKKELLNEARENKKRKGNGKKFSKISVTPTIVASVSDDRYDVILGGKVSTVALGDTGSDENVIDCELFEKLKLEGCPMKIEQFQTMMPMKCAITTANQVEYNASKRLTISITIILPGSNLPLRVHRVPFMVVNQKMEESIMGRSFLKKIGFDLHDHLLRTQYKTNGKQFDELNSEDIKFAALSYRGMR